jgi:hypothetical protein
MSLSQSTFVPETQRNLIFVDNFGYQSSWPGTGIDGLSLLPNGFYQVHVVQAAKPDLILSFWIKHDDAVSFGTVILENNPVPVGTDLVLHYYYSESMEIHARVYNIAGELICQASGVGITGSLPVGFRSSSGKAVSAGVYIIDVRAFTVNGHIESDKVLKAAVVR